MPSPARFFEDVNEGDNAPEVFIERLTRTQIVKYAGASGDFTPYHTDEIYAIRIGYDRVFAMGMLTAGFIAHMASDWFGLRNIKKIKFRFLAQLWPGDSVRCKGIIRSKFSNQDGNFVEANIWADNQNGEKLV